MQFVIAGATGTVGRHVVDVAVRRGHKVIVLSRSSGHDILTGAGLADAMTGSDAVIDVTSTTTVSGATATQFFTRVTARLHDAERAVDVGHHIGLSIVGIDGIDAGYFAGKLAHERAVEFGPIPWTILRASQFHEFTEQVVARGSIGSFAAVPKMLMRPVAAREVGERLVEIAEHAPLRERVEMRGPRDERLVDLVRRMFTFDHSGRRSLELSLPGRYWRALASGALRGDPSASTGRIDFDEWLRSGDHTRP
jgi:uncharacterized protein YbjT (DUF2867 family)